MQRYSRKPAAAILLATLAGGAFFFYATGHDAQANNGPALEELEVMIAQPNAKSDIWNQYAQRLQEHKRFAHAAMAFRRVLEADPYNRQVRLQCATNLALAGGGDDFALFMRECILADPQLAVDIFERPEAQTYLAEDRFQALAKEARIQSMD